MKNITEVLRPQKGGSHFLPFVISYNEKTYTLPSVKDYVAVKLQNNNIFYEKDSDTILEVVHDFCSFLYFSKDSNRTLWKSHENYTEYVNRILKLDMLLLEED